MDSDLVGRTVKLIRGCERIDRMDPCPGRDIAVKRVIAAAKRWPAAVLEAGEDPDEVFDAAVKQMEVVV